MHLSRIAFALVACCSCMSSPLPRLARPEVGVTEAGSTRVLSSSFDQANDALRVALAANQYGDLIAKELGYKRDDPVEVWLCPESPALATTFEHCIVLDIYDRRMESLDGILAHELVHWHAFQTPLQRNLPHVAYEGLADVVAADLVPEWKVDRSAQATTLLGAARGRGDLSQVIERARRLTARQWAAHPGNDRLYELYSLGFTLVGRIGVDALIAAAEQGPVSLEEILEMAGVGADGSGLVVGETAGAVGGSHTSAPTKPVCLEMRFFDAHGADLSHVTIETPGSVPIPPGAMRSWTTVLECRDAPSESR